MNSSNSAARGVTVACDMLIPLVKENVQLPAGFLQNAFDAALRASCFAGDFRDLIALDAELDHLLVWSGQPLQGVGAGHSGNRAAWPHPGCPGESAAVTSDRWARHATTFLRGTPGLWSSHNPPGRGLEVTSTRDYTRVPRPFPK